jgi:GH35 family endo-1,4-beta-xylanase
MRKFKESNRIRLKSILTICTIGFFFLSSAEIKAQEPTYPPSCVITIPYSNAYFKTKSDVLIKVYATDFGKTKNNGKVSEVEFYNGNKLLGKTKIQKDNTYEFLWKKVKAGTYTIRAKATNDKGVSFTSVGVIITVGDKEVVSMGLSAGKGKYLANIHQRVPFINYDEYWNGVTAENACKWESIEATRDIYTWGGADSAYHYARDRHMIFRYHAGLWASQYPTWFTSLSTQEAKEEIIENLKAIAERFPLADQIDLLNEQLHNHQRDNQKFRELLGGSGTKENDFDWQIWLFSEARKIFPNTKLVLNDYGLEGDRKAIRDQLELFKVLRDRGIIDGFGTQAHCFNVDRPSADTIKSSLDFMATSGLPIYATELDMNGGVSGRRTSDSLQLISYKKVIPTFFEHPAVAGITLWGYVQNTTWINGTGIVSKEGVENPSMVWLKSYMKSLPDVGYPMSTLSSKKKK